jgi:3-oxoacyl-[acyl-carrier protein] reductase
MATGRLQGRVAIVTGASRGIGRAVAERLAAEGVDLVLGYARDDAAMDAAEAACVAAGARVRRHRADLADPATAAALVDLAVKDLGRLDILCNNAAVVVDDLLAMLDDADLERMVQVNVVGLVRLTRACLRPMLRRRAGAIVNLSSVTATRPGRGNSVYAGTKGFVDSFTRALAVEVGRKGVRVNAVAPGIVDTAMSAGVRAVAGDALLARIPLGRLATPADVAAAVVFLASDEAAYVNGAVLGCDGGFT